MMKQKILKRLSLTLSLVFLLGSLAGCMGTPGRAGGSGTSDSENETNIPGTYTVPDGWVKWEQNSTKNKIFYVEEGHEDDDLPDNISVEVGRNRYSIDEHMEFSRAILRQLYMQVQGIDAEVTGAGTYTEQDYIAYIFTIDKKDVVSKQYYIVDDRRYCLIHLTNHTGSESLDEAAQTMVDSFVWD